MRLPRHSYYKAALESDEEYAAYALAFARPGAERVRVPLVGYDEVALRLDNLFDAINAVNDTLLAAPHFKRKSRQAVRAPRPETAQQRVKRQQSRENLDSIVEQMTGGR